MYRCEQHCPVARAAELVGERWTLPALPELPRGNELRADIADGVPRRSARPLTTRLRTLAAHGLAVELPAHGHERRYQPTEAGPDLGSAVDQRGWWGRRWPSPPALGDLAVDVLPRGARAQMAGRLPDRPLTGAVAVADTPSAGRRWLALSPTGAAVPGEAPVARADVRLLCTLSGLAKVWPGGQTWVRARERTVMFVGSPDAVRSVLACVGLSSYVAGPRESA